MIRIYVLIRRKWAYAYRPRSIDADYTVLISMLFTRARVTLSRELSLLAFFAISLPLHPPPPHASPPQPRAVSYFSRPPCMISRRTDVTSAIVGGYFSFRAIPRSNQPFAGRFKKYYLSWILSVRPIPGQINHLFVIDRVRIALRMFIRAVGGRGGYTRAIPDDTT